MRNRCYRDLFEMALPPKFSATVVTKPKLIKSIASFIDMIETAIDHDIKDSDKDSISAHSTLSSDPSVISFLSGDLKSLNLGDPMLFIQTYIKALEKKYIREGWKKVEINIAKPNSKDRAITVLFNLSA